MILKIFYASLVVGSLIAVKVMNSPGKIISVEESTVKATLVEMNYWRKGRLSFVFRGEDNNYYREDFYPSSNEIKTLSRNLKDSKTFILRLVKIKRDNRNELCVRTIRDQDGNSFNQEDKSLYIDGTVVPSCFNSIDIVEEPIQTSV